MRSPPFPDENLYGLLGIDHTASLELIRQAYRRQAMNWHPDRNTAAEAEHTFKRIRFAYDVLRDADRRRDYDHHLATRPAYAPARETGRAADLNRHVRISLHEQIYGCKVKLKLTRTDYCTHCAGSGNSSAPPVSCPTCHGSGEVRPVLGLFVFFGGSAAPCTTCNGKGRIPVPCTTCTGSGILARKTGHLRFDVPAGIRPGSNLRVRGHGRRGRRGETAGDLLARIELAEHPLFAPDFPHLRCAMPVSIFRALAHGRIEVPTVDTLVEVSLTAEAIAAKELRIAGHGLLDGAQGQRGDLLIALQLVAPDELSMPQRELLEQLEQLSADNALQRDWQQRLRRAVGAKRKHLADDERD